LLSIGWLTAEDARTLQNTVRHLRQQRLMASLLREDVPEQLDTRAAADVFRRKMEESSRALP
jgi:hypothetical protein